MGVLKPLEERVIIKPEDVTPSNEDTEVVGVTNPGGALVEKNSKEITYLLLRVIEKTKESFPEHIAFARAIPCGDKYKVFWEWEREGKDAEISGPNSLRILGPEERARLTTISHLRLARSEDGINFKISEKPTFFPSKKYEEFGIEDARITEFKEGIPIGEENYNYLISYVSLSEDNDVSTSFAVTNDFESFIRLPKENPQIIFFASNKDVVLFPKKILNQRTSEKEYAALTRPSGSGFMLPSIYLSYSRYLIQWGDHQLFVKGDERGHVGAGPPPIEVEEGFLVIYHQHRHYGKGQMPPNDKEYIGSALLVDKENPRKILKKTSEFMKPHLSTGLERVVPNVTFPSATIIRDGKLFIYSGEEDAATAVHIYYLKEFLEFLRPC